VPRGLGKLQEERKFPDYNEGGFRKEGGWGGDIETENHLNLLGGW
jgi:hypothetical protein